jgi:23S rRNA G2069 N7-methylase RlmK/C1962 C5-methylase RlmI
LPDYLLQHCREVLRDLGFAHMQFRHTFDRTSSGPSARRRGLTLDRFQNAPHIRPASNQPEPAHDAAYDAFVKLYQESSEIKQE